MIKVAICDDETNIRSYLASLVRKQAVDCEIAEYSSADAFLAAGEEHDLLFLDIDLEGVATGSAANIVPNAPDGTGFASDSYAGSRADWKTAGEASESGEAAEAGKASKSGEDAESAGIATADSRSPSYCMDGIALARRLRGMNLHRQPLIVFVTGYDSYVYEAFDVEAFQYLIKPIDEARFAELFRRALQRITSETERQLTVSAAKPQPSMPEMEQHRKSLVIQQAGVRKVVPWEKIYYAESQGHKVLLHFRDSILEYYGKMGELEQSLPGQFFRIHKGYLINLAYVEEYTHTSVTLANGAQLMISKYKYDDFAKAHLQYLL